MGRRGAAVRASTREQVEDPVQPLVAGPGSRRHEPAEPQVLLHGQLGDHAAALGHVRHAQRGHLLDRRAGDVAAVEPHAAAPGPDQPGDRAQQRRLAGAVGAEDGGDLAAPAR